MLAQLNNYRHTQTAEKQRPVLFLRNLNTFMKTLLNMKKIPLFPTIWASIHQHTAQALLLNQMCKPSHLEYYPTLSLAIPQLSTQGLDLRQQPLKYLQPTQSSPTQHSHSSECLYPHLVRLKSRNVICCSVK